MSKQQNTALFPDSSGKAFEEDKCALYESSKTDSGFLSGEIISEEITDSGVIDIDSKPSHSYSGIVEDKSEMRKLEEHTLVESGVNILDSGVCLSDNFSKFSISQEDPCTPTKLTRTPVELFEAIQFYYEQDEDGDTHLHTAIVQGFVEVALALIRAAPYPRLLDTPNYDLQTPLHLAVETGQSEIARCLIVAGARPCPRGIHGDSPLHVAARNNDLKSIKAIADPVKQQERDQLALSYQGHKYQPCDFDQWNFLGQTCVHIAAMHGNRQVLEHLVWYGADINAKEGCMGYTALHYAVQQRNEALLQFLLKCKNLDIEAETYGGRNALEINLILPTNMRQELRKRGLPSPYSSDEEVGSDSGEDEEEMMYENVHKFSVPMVNANA